MLAPSPQPQPIALRFALAFVWRELRGGLRGFGVFIACIALGVMAIAGVGSVAASLNDGIAASGQMILGGDIAFALIQREANPDERAFLDAQGTMSVAATMRAMARTNDGRLALVEAKAVDDRYPLYGTVTTDPAMSLPELFAQRDGAFGAAVDPALLARLDLKVGDRITLGGATIALRAVLTVEPDRLTAGINLGPRVLLSEAALRATGLLQPGTLIRWQYRLRLPATATDASIDALQKQATQQFPDAGWEVRSRSKASPQLERSVERFTQFLTLVGLTTLLIGGVGVANAVASHMARKRDVIGTMKALGATGGDVFTAYCTEVMLVALLATIIGAVLGAGLPFVIVFFFGKLIPLPITPAVFPGVLLLSIAYGLLTALAFALWPLGRAQDISVSMMFRDQIAAERPWPRARYVAATAAIVVLLSLIAIFTTYDQRVAAFFVVAAAALFLLLRLVALLTMAVARRAPRAGSTIVRLAIANIHRIGALTPSVMLSLGLGLALLVTVVEIDGNLHREFAAALPEHAPSFFFVDIPAADAERFDGFIQQKAPGATLDRVPMMRGRIVSANGIAAEDIKAAPGSRWVLSGDRGITYANAVPVGSHLTAGQWWSADYKGEPLVSLENRTAADLGLKIGDTITVNVLGRNITARIANLRAVDWENLGINFVMVFTPVTFAGAPHSDIATLTFADGGTTAEETAVIKAMADAFPSVTSVRIKDALDAIDALVGKLVLALRGASAITLIAAALVLGGALAAGQRQRVYDAVVLKTLGATRARLTAAYALEYLLIGVATAVFAIAAGSIAADIVVTRVMDFPFVWVAGEAIATAAAALTVTVTLGLAGTFSALGRKPAEVLRNL
ncbi:MAG TPA: FtsX-like permease family protein [Xanthobacteraceae bacterium]|jgi:putative ABC transport system permease protein|nr:FtsX-like permease family protein [Xanthobacteraceae bacterium]